MDEGSGPQRVPLVVYIDGEGRPVGTASVHEDGTIDARITNQEMIERLNPTDISHYSIDAPQNFMTEEINKLRRRTTPIYRKKK